MMVPRVSLLLVAALASITGLAVPVADEVGSSSLAYYVPDDSDSPIPGYTVGVQEWDVEISPGQTVQLNGTVQEVVAQASKLNPGFAAAFEANMEKANAEAEAKAKANEVSLSNSNLAASGAVCGVWPEAMTSILQDGVKYLRGLGYGSARAKGPKYCSRVSCSYRSAIWLCNDNDHDILIGGWYGWDTVANSAQHVINTCSWEHKGCINNDCPFMVTNGQNFEQDNWNTILRDAPPRKGCGL